MKSDCFWDTLRKMWMVSLRTRPVDKNVWAAGRSMETRRLHKRPLPSTNNARKSIVICGKKGKVTEGAQADGAKVTLLTAKEFTPVIVDCYDAIAFGCPAMGAEVLEEDEFEPMFTACQPKLRDKRIALFGSYGWGGGEWMRNWEETCQEIGAVGLRQRHL